MSCEKIEEILGLYRLAKSRKWKPWELQTRMKELCENVVAVGDDLSFTLKLSTCVRDVNLDFGRKCSIHPFRNAYRFDRGFIAFEKNFIRISREIDEELLVKLLKLILPEG
jgi:hypothetical protein